MSAITLVLVASLVLLGGVAGPVLARGRWSAVHPGSAIVAWAAVIVGIGGTLAGILLVALFWPPSPGHGLLERLERCSPLHGHAGAVSAAVVSLAALAFCAHRLGRGLPRVWRAKRQWRQHREMLGMVARAAADHHDVLVIDHPVPVAYCVPARHRPIVVSAGALERLDQQQLGAVLAHERTHLAQRHHLILMILDVAYAALPWLPTVRLARARLPLLLEMAADDGARRLWGSRALHEALCRLTILPGSAGTLAASGESLSPRLSRLTRTPEPSRRGVRPLAWTASALAIGGPLTLVLIAVIMVPLPC